MGVNLHVDLETLQLIQGPGQRSAVNSLRFKRGDAARLQVVFLENGITPATIGDPDTLDIQFGIKPRNQFDRTYLAHSADWSMPSEGDDAPAYRCILGLNTLQLNSALNIGSTTAEEIPEITLMGEITWREGSGEPTSTRTFLVVVENDVNRGTEGVPTSATPAYPAPTNIELVTRKGVANGYAGLDSSGKVPSSQLPAATSGEGYELQTNKGTPGGYAGLDSNGKVPEAQLPAMTGGGGITFDPYTLALGYSAFAGSVAAAVGPSAYAADNAVAFGYNTRAQGYQSTGIGYSATAYGYMSTAIGANSSAQENAVAINGNAWGINSLAILGYANGTNGISIGYQANAYDTHCIALGAYSYAGGDMGVSFGYGAYVNLGVAIGGSANGSSGGTAVGYLSYSSPYAVAYGYNARAEGEGSIAIGRNCRISENNSMLIAPDGGYSYGWIKTDAARRLMFSIPVTATPPSGSSSSMGDLTTGELIEGGACFQISADGTELHFYTYQANSMRKAVIPLTYA